MYHLRDTNCVMKDSGGENPQSSVHTFITNCPGKLRREGFERIISSLSNLVLTQFSLYKYGLTGLCFLFMWLSSPFLNINSRQEKDPPHKNGKL